MTNQSKKLTLFDPVSLRAPRTMNNDAFDFLSGGGELAERIRELDWSQTPLGPLETWPQSLRTSVSLILNSHHPMWIGWGPHATFLYNDAYLSVLGAAKHPWALGRPASDVWAEIWDVCGPLAANVFERGQATFVDEVQLFMDRGGYLEETYYSFSYSPIRDESGNVAGLFCPSASVTDKILNARRLQTLSELAANALVEKTIVSACTSAIRTIGRNADDIPFAVIYLVDAEGANATLQATTLPEVTSGTFPLHQSLRTEASGDVWRLAQVYATAIPEVISIASLSPIAIGLAGRPVAEAHVLPVIPSGQERAAAILIAGVNPTRKLDSAYRTFFSLLATHFAAAIANARFVEEERRRVESLAELDRAKTAFFSNVSHEFRTPLTLMLGPAEEALAATATTPENRERLEIIHRNATRLQKLVNTLLDFSRLEAGRVRPHFEPTDLSEFTEDLASLFRSAVERAGVSYHVECTELREPFYIDREMWEKVVLNLLSNALKFTFEGKIEVRLQRSLRAEEDGAAILTVRDTGTGIPATELDHVFERFHRVEGARGRTHEGTGIGLALAAELVKLHGGTIGVESTVGQGSAFTITIPAGKQHLENEYVSGTPSDTSQKVTGGFVEETLRWLPDAESQIVTTEQGISEPRPSALTKARRPRIVLADDNADMRDYITRLLAPLYHVLAFKNGREAFDAIQAKRPDLLITDVMMPELDGFGLVGAIRADVATRSLPVVMLSARVGEESLIEGVSAGADDYLVKPFSARELLARVASHIKIAELRSESERAVRESEKRRRLALDAAEFGSWNVNPADNTITADERFRFIFQGTTDPITYEQAFACVHPDDRERIRDAVAAATRGDNPAPYAEEYRVVHRNGSIHWVTARGRATVANVDGESVVASFDGTVGDITVRKNAEDALAELRRRNQAALSAAEVGAYYWDIATDRVYGDRNFVPLFGVLLDERSSAPLGEFLKVIHPDDLPPVRDAIQATLKNDVPFEIEYRIIGTPERWVIARGVVERNDAGEAVGWAGAVVDITGRKRAEQLEEDQRVVLQLVAEGASLSTTLDALVSMMERHSSSGFKAAILLCEADARQYRLEASSGFALPMAQELERLVAVNARSLDQHEESPAENLSAASSRFWEQLEQHGVQHSSSTPIAASDGRTLGLLALFAAHDVPADAETAALATMATRAIAITVERKQAEETLRESEQRYRLVGDAANDAIWDWNLSTNQVIWNEGLHARFGYAADAVDPDSSWWSAHIHADDRERVIHGIHATLDDGAKNDWSDEYRFLRADGTAASVFDRGRVVRDESGRALRMVGSMLDLTERRQTEQMRERLLEEAQQARAEAEAANSMKDEFLATLSHELRTPLNAILGWSQLLKDSRLGPADRQEGIDAIERNSRVQAQLIEDLLDISRIISGKLRLDVQHVAPIEFIEAAIVAVIPAAAARDVRIHKVLDPAAGVVAGDPARLQQVVWNLLSNAVKFTPKGGKIEVLLERVNSHIEIIVSDTGQGIQPDFLPHVFDRFRQADGSTTRQHGGLGLGLSIVRQLVEMHGGNVRAKSPGEGKGATFIVSLPITISRDRPRENATPRTRPLEDGPCTTMLRGLNILVVDDEPDARRLMEKILSDCEANVRCVDSVQGALQAISESLPDVLVSDIGMPGEDGYDLIAEIRGRGISSRDLPAVALTAFARSEDRRRAMLAGFQVHVVKPADANELVAVVASLAGRTGGGFKDRIYGI